MKSDRLITEISISAYGLEILYSTMTRKRKKEWGGIGGVNVCHNLDTAKNSKESRGGNEGERESDKEKKGA